MADVPVEGVTLQPLSHSPTLCHITVISLATDRQVTSRHVFVEYIGSATRRSKYQPRELRFESFAAVSPSIAGNRQGCVSYRVVIVSQGIDKDVFRIV